jgi:thioredoxin-like negative regulator of GroEL
MRLTYVLLLVIYGVFAGIPEPSDSRVQVLTAQGIERFVKRNDLAVIEFYAPWCGHCQELAPVYREAAKMVEEADLPMRVAFGKYDDTDPGNAALRAGDELTFGLKSYPTIIIFKKNHVKVANKEHWSHHLWKKRWQYYGGGRDSPEEFLYYLTALAHGRDPFDEERHRRPGFYKPGGKHESDKIVELEPDGPNGFNTTVLEDDFNRVWIVEFYSDRCPFCNSLAPEMIKAATKIYQEKGKKVIVGAINSRVYDEVAEQHGVTSWPWVTSFYRGQKVEDMAGLGGWESVYKFALRIYDQSYSKPPPPNVFLDSPWSSQNQAARAVKESAASDADTEAQNEKTEL